MYYKNVLLCNINTDGKRMQALHIIHNPGTPKMMPLMVKKLPQLGKVCGSGQLSASGEQIEFHCSAN